MKKKRKSSQVDWDSMLFATILIICALLTLMAIAISIFTVLWKVG